MKVSPFAPAAPQQLSAITGIRLASCASGIKRGEATDLSLIEFAAGSTVAGCFTKSTTAGAPVNWCRKALKSGHVRAIIVNSGNANVFTGSPGDETVRLEVDSVASALSAAHSDVFVCSTGVIGEPLDGNLIARAVPGLVASLQSASWHEAASAIMTTDTYPKVSTRSCAVASGQVTINGIAKGSGMIAPDMATTLSFLGTDARISAADLQSLLSECVEDTFNCITVEGDTSTSDTILIGATGKGSQVETQEDLAKFKAALREVLFDLSQQVVDDGEGVSKRIEISLSGAPDRASARMLAMHIANSPLFKTAIAGGDANWGRVVMALGKSQMPFDLNRLKIWFNDLPVAESGRRASAYNEKAMTALVNGDSIRVRVEVGEGPGSILVRTTDLTSDFVDLNANYRS